MSYVLASQLYLLTSNFLQSHNLTDDDRRRTRARRLDAVRREIVQRTTPDALIRARGLENRRRRRGGRPPSFDEDFRQSPRPLQAHEHDQRDPMGLELTDRRPEYLLVMARDDKEGGGDAAMGHRNAGERWRRER